MKTKKLEKKLSFQKTTISDLDKILGGSDGTIKLAITRLCTVTVCQTQCPSAPAPYHCMYC